MPDEYNFLDEVKRLFSGELDLDERWKALQWLENGGLAELRLQAVDDSILALGGGRGATAQTAARFEMTTSGIHSLRDRVEAKRATNPQVTRDSVTRSSDRKRR